MKPLTSPICAKEDKETSRKKQRKMWLRFKALPGVWYAVISFIYEKSAAILQRIVHIPAGQKTGFIGEKPCGFLLLSYWVIELLRGKMIA